ncbi:hypothetical protein M885DRAFT_513709 [Pelagophyceae sp. CCMP2097]|nr:hypothetical protein M885DRAFT_513709 [Pelagophyceae sp. CCMP2097]
MKKFPIIAHTLGGLSINDLEKFASAARFCYGLFKHLRHAKSCVALPYPAALQKEFYCFYGFYGLEVTAKFTYCYTTGKKDKNQFSYTIHAKDGQLSKKRTAPADPRWVGRNEMKGTGNSLGPDALATALHREERERLHAEHRVAKGLEPNYVYNFPRDPLECLYSLEHAFAEATDMKRFFGVRHREGGWYEALLSIPGAGRTGSTHNGLFNLGQCETKAATMYNCATMLVGKATKTKRFFNICPAVTIKAVDSFDKMNQKRAAAKKPLPALYVSGKTLKDTLPEKRFDDEFFVAIDWLRKQSGRKKRWTRCNRSAPLPESAASGDELVPDPMLLGELRTIRRWNRWLAARGHAAASTLRSSSLEQRPP